MSYVGLGTRKEAGSVQPGQGLNPHVFQTETDDPNPMNNPHVAHLT